MPVRVAFAASALLLLPASVQTIAPAIAPAVEAPVDPLRAQLATLRVDHTLLQADLNLEREISSSLRMERDALIVSNDQLTAENSDLIVETTDLNRELLDLELALAAVEQAVSETVEQQTVYNFVNVPIGSPIPDGVGATVEAPAPIAVPQADPAESSGPSGDEMIAAFYRDIQSGVPADQLLETLDGIIASQLVSRDNIHDMYQELMYLWEE